MASLDRVPTELVELTCSFLSTGDTLSLCSSSKGIYSVVHPLLFRHVTIKWDQCAAPDEPPNITSLLQFILRNPSYARYIQTLDVPNVVYDACLAWSRRLKKGNPWHWGPEDKALVRAAIGECVLPHADDWYRAVVERANLGAITALVLAQCTHLQSLTVDASFIPTSNEWFPGVLRPVIRPSLSVPEPPTRPPVLPRLAHVTVTQDDTRSLHPTYDPRLEMYAGDHEEPGGEPPEALFLFFYLPRLTTLRFNYEPYGRDRQPWDPLSVYYQMGLRWPIAYPPLAASLTTLQLDWIMAPASAIEFLLRHTPNLQSLAYDCNLPSPCSPLDLDVLRQGLDHVRSTLTHLVIRYDIEKRFVDPDPTSLREVTRGSLGPLSSLTALRNLEVSPLVLLGQVAPQAAPPLAAVLPGGLRRLVLNDDLWHYDAFEKWMGEPTEALLKDFFAGACKTATPLLDEFVLDMEFKGSESDEYWEDEVVKDRLQQLVEGQRIKCAIRMSLIRIGGLRQLSTSDAGSDISQDESS